MLAQKAPWTRPIPRRLAELDALRIAGQFRLVRVVDPGAGRVCIGVGLMNLSGADTEGREWLELLFETIEPGLRRALVAAYGLELGREATAEALAWACQHPERLAGTANPMSYLYRVGQSKIRRRKVRLPLVRVEWREPWFEPGLAAALGSLSQRQRVVVVLIHAYDWTPAEVASLLGLRVTTIQTHLSRGLATLRARLEVSGDP